MFNGISNGYSGNYQFITFGEEVLNKQYIKRIFKVYNDDEKKFIVCAIFINETMAKVRFTKEEDANNYLNNISLALANEIISFDTDEKEDEK